MTPRSTIAYQPALDGVRALAVIAVLFFHAGVLGFDGGYLGVSVFFTLSGYLITSLLIQEHDGTGRVDLRQFYARRVRRLLPASLLCIGVVALLAATTDLFDQVANLRAHIVGSLLQVANWVFLAGDGSYQDLIARTAGTASPLEHFWSLSIEEQFYWVWPPVMVVLLSKVASRRGRMAAIGTMTVIATVAAPLIAATWGADAAYWATPARMAEILMGAFVAVVFLNRAVPGKAGALAPLALVVLAVAVVTFPSSDGPAYSGALPLVAVVSASLIVGLQAPSGVRSALELPALVAIGRISYGLYLFHWPIYLIIHPDRVDVPGPVLLALRLSLTLVAAVVSYRLVEQPIRSSGRFAPTVTFTAGAAATAALVLVSVSGPSPTQGEYWLAEAGAAEAASIEVVDAPLQPLQPLRELSPTTTVVESTVPTVSRSSAPDLAPTPSASPSTNPEPGAVPRSSGNPTADSSAGADTTWGTIATIPRLVVSTIPVTKDDATPSTTIPSSVPSPSSALAPLPALSRPVRIVVVGDSTANAFGTGLVEWAAAEPELAQVEIVAAPGCGFVEGGERRVGDSIEPIAGCEGWVDEFVLPAVERLEPDVVMAMVTSWDLIDRRWDTEELLSPFDAAYADRLRGDYRRLADDLIASGAAQVTFVKHPTPDPYWLDRVDAQEDPERHAVVYDIYDSLSTTNDRVHTIELAEWMTEHRLDISEETRPDGIHATPGAATQIADDYLGEQLVRIAIGASRP